MHYNFNGITIRNISFTCTYAIGCNHEDLYICIHLWESICEEKLSFNNGNAPSFASREKNCFAKSRHAKTRDNKGRVFHEGRELLKLSERNVLTRPREYFSREKSKSKSMSANDPTTSVRRHVADKM